VVDGTVVGDAAIRPAVDEPGAWVLALSVDPGWRRRGIGSSLLGEAVRQAAGRGGTELVLTTSADNQAVLPMVLAAGLRGRIRMSGDRLTVRIPLAALHR
jgi:ribosomal protein S18 acetylase RimI-like enzyme